MDKNTSFCSERLSYHGITRDDADLIVKWRSDPGNYRNFFSGRPVTLEEHLAWFENYLKDQGRYDFMIVDEEGSRIGTVGLSSYNGRSCEISYMIGEESARGKGYAREAVRTMTQLAFDNLGVEHVDACILAGNEASVHVAESTGYVLYEQVYRSWR